MAVFGPLCSFSGAALCVFAASRENPLLLALFHARCAQAAKTQSQFFAAFSLCVSAALRGNVLLPVCCFTQSRRAAKVKKFMGGGGEEVEVDSGAADEADAVGVDTDFLLEQVDVVGVLEY